MVIQAYFKAGTKVFMADNTFKLIEDIKVGDYVDALQVKEPVKEVFQAEATDLIVITGESGHSISVTPEQSFRANNPHKTFAKNLKVGDLILYFPTPDDLLAEEIINIAWVKNLNSKVYNFSLEENHNFNANGFMSLDFICQQNRY